MIRVLDKFIADKIAAGEVIERPVSAVKELVENSIDAGASSVIVEIRGGGKSYIRVTDDGCGIPPEEAETAFLRHATSKISSVADLGSIHSLGFRGEALASIAAVSRLTIVTRTSDRKAGVRLILHGGKVIVNETAGCNPGTTIVVEDLFYNTPARRKFMGSDAREGSAIIELIQQYAVCYPSIRFMMVRNGETVFNTAGDGDTLRTIKMLYPDADHADLLPVEGEHVHGYVSDPGTTKNTRKGQLFFVNGRLVDSKVIEKGLVNGYGGRIFSGHPVAVLFIETDPAETDVNIHPGKREIRFLREKEIAEAVTSAVSSSMMTAGSVPRGLPARPDAEHARPVRSDAELASSADPKDAAPADLKAESADAETSVSALRPAGGSASPEAYSMVSDGPVFTGEQSSIREYLGSLRRGGASDAAADEPHKDKAYRRADKADEPAAGADLVNTSAEAAGKVSDDPDDSEHQANVWMPSAIHAPARKLFDFDELEYKGYLFDTFIVMQSKDTVYLFDQHAAHERIFYERFTSNYLSGDKYTQPILTPVTISVSADVYYMSRDWLMPLTEAGYDIEDFGANTFMIRGIPSYMEVSEAESFARSYLEGLDTSSGRNDVVIDKLIMKSCKSAVKANERLSRQEADQLIADLAKCSDPYCCPHGRPTFIRYTRYEIERSFKRK